MRAVGRLVKEEQIKLGHVSFGMYAVLCYKCKNGEREFELQGTEIKLTKCWLYFFVIHAEEITARVRVHRYHTK